jgi:hypothetical protein
MRTISGTTYETLCCTCFGQGRREVDADDPRDRWRLDFDSSVLRRLARTAIEDANGDRGSVVDRGRDHRGLSRQNNRATRLQFA